MRPKEAAKKRSEFDTKTFLSTIKGGRKIEARPYPSNPQSGCSTSGTDLAPPAQTQDKTVEIRGRRALAPESEIERIGEQFLVIGATVEQQWQ